MIDCVLQYPLLAGSSVNAFEGGEDDRLHLRFAQEFKVGMKWMRETKLFSLFLAGLSLPTDRRGVKFVRNYYSWPVDKAVWK